MRLCYYLLGALLGLAAAAPDPDAKKTTLTYTIYDTTTSTKTITGRSTKTIYTQTTNTGYEESIIYVYNGTVTNYYYTYTSTDFKSIKASATVTVPTSAGFTPVLLEPPYTDALSFVTVTSTVVLTSTYDPSPATVTSQNALGTYVRTSTVTTTEPTTIDTTTSTSTTVTISAATQTVYEACNKNNIASKVPTGQGINNVAYSGTANLAIIQDVADATACCELCQGTKDCLFSEYDLQNGNMSQPCYVYTPGSGGTCNPGVSDSTFGYSASEASVSGGNPFMVYSNGECGQVTWDPNL